MRDFRLRNAGTNEYGFEARIAAFGYQRSREGSGKTGRSSIPQASQLVVIVLWMEVTTIQSV